MTIAAAYLTSEGVVLGADSTTAVSVAGPEGGGGVVQLFRHAQKVFEVGEKSRLGLCTWGSGSVGNISHRTLAARLADGIDQETTTVSDAAETLKDLAYEALKSSTQPSDDVGYYLGGWSPDGHGPECYMLRLPPDGQPEIKPLEVGMASFSGSPKFFVRVFRGYDANLYSGLLGSLKAKLDSVPSDFDSRFDDAFREATAPLVAAGFRDLPIREAIDYIHTYLHVTVKASKFMFGPPVCGGPIEVAFVSTDRLFRWVCHKGFGSAIAEEEVWGHGPRSRADQGS